MLIRNSSTRFGVLAQLLHWGIAGLIAVQVVLAENLEDLASGAQRTATLASHVSVGITIFALVILRLIWRRANVTPALPATLGPRERKLARLSHAALYVMLLLVPLSGWMTSSAQDVPARWFNVLRLPDLVARSPPADEFLRTAHEILAYAFATLLFVHILAALRHHFLLKNDVLRRMLPFTKERKL